MKKIFLAVFVLIFSFSCVNAEAPKGGFYVLDGPPSGFSVGGTAQIDWRDLEPEEGKIRWELFTDPNATYIAWIDVFNKRIHNDPRPITPRPSMAKLLYDATKNGQKFRFKLRVSEGAMPLWLYGGEDVNGKSSSSYGTICGRKTAEQGWNLEPPDCNKDTDIVLAVTYPLYPQKEDNAQPIWWSPVFQEKYTKIIRLVAEKIKSDPNLYKGIEFVEASLGSYGEMILYGKSDTFTYDSPNQQLFRAAGYTNAKYADSIAKHVDAYVRYFADIPVAISLGTGLYSSPYNDGSGVNSVLTYTLDNVWPKYGSRIYLKFAGFPNRHVDMPRYCPSKTRCIYETFGNITQWPGWPWNNEAASLQRVLETAVTDGAYIVMIWWADPRVISDTGNTNLLNAYPPVIPKLQAKANITPPSPPPLPALGGESVGVSLSFKKGVNKINWLSSYLTGRSLTTVPSECKGVSFKDMGRWNTRGIFTSGKSYYLKCTGDVSWEL